MALSLFPMPNAIRISQSSTDPKHYALSNGYGPYFSFIPGHPPFRSDDIQRYDDGDLTNKSNVNPHTSNFSGSAYVEASFHGDFHFRLWVIPEILNLSNPQTNTDIPFRIWNTNENPETVQSILVNGSSVLSFDLQIGDTIRDFQYRLVNMQIGDGEANINATVQFQTDTLVGLLKVIAAVSDTLNLIPDVPVKEIWEFKTDVLRNIFGDEQRIALRRYPRIRQEFEIEIIDLRQRREQYELLRRNIKVQSLVPMYQYAVNATGVTPIGGTTIFLETDKTNLRVGEQLIAINPTDEKTVIGKVVQINSNSVVISSSAGYQIDPHWVIVPAISCIISDGNGISMNNVTGRLKITADSYKEPPLVRAESVTSVGTFDGIIHLDRRPIIPADEDFEYEREIIDNEIGSPYVVSKWKQPKISGDRTFLIQRVANPSEMDYWRSFFDSVRGSWKPFLLSTWFPDLSLANIPDPGSGVLNIEQGYYENQFFPYDAYKRIQIEYKNGDISQHVVTSATIQEDGTSLIGISPALVDSPEYYGENIKMISFLVKVKATDRVVWRHYANYSEVRFGIESTDQ